MEASLEKLKLPNKWYSLEDAALRLTCTLHKSVSVTDVLKLAISNNIDLYWKALGVYIRSSSRKEMKEIAEKNSMAMDVSMAWDHEEKSILESVSTHFKLEIIANVYVRNYIKSLINSEAFEPDISGKIIVYDPNGGFFIVIAPNREKYIKKIEARDDRAVAIVSFANTKYDPESFDKFFEKYNFEDSHKLPLPQELGFLRSDLEAYEKAELIKMAKKKSLDPREDNYSLRVLLGLAKHHYNFDASVERSRAPKQISLMLRKLKIKVGSETISKRLKDASQLPPQKLDD